ncbi:MAG: condensation domain-containing protein [Acidobacteria bacterium]|jgi:acyl transferase domain-containing protein/acyl carrier protein|nr:condensation domain-containing protein [Acidobacteriota bacterium]
MMYKLDALEYTGLEVAVIGMAARFPGAQDIDESWNNLKNGIESVYFFTDDELEELGVSSELRNEPNFVKAKALLANPDCFDAAFFGYSPKEAEILDPQLRIFHECAWTALENAGYNPDRYEGLIGLYAGASANLNWAAYTLASGKSNILGYYAASMLNNKDYLCTRISYNLNLRGPAVSIQTACSTSLVAVHLACQGILSGECDMALAGGVALSFQQNNGYLYQDGMILSPDGHTRTFDKDAHGTITGEGAGIVVLKSLEDAAADGDHIYALIRGSAINNDGSYKVGFTAPSVKGQVGVITAAMRAGHVEPGTIGFIEAHGTATELGDPVEIESLKQAFNTDKRNFCAIGSVKSNFGHLDTAAGVAGFIKTVLTLYYKTIPPSLHFKTPNPKLDLENSPFYVNTGLKKWQNDRHPLRAGVSSFGIGGTNAHVVLEEAPPFIREMDYMPRRAKEIIVLSARTETALNTARPQLVKFIETHNDVPLEDIAYTLQVGRKAFSPHRAMTLAGSLEEAAQALSSPESGKLHVSVTKEEDRHVIFMFSGQGAQYVNMGLDLYQSEPVFRAEMDRCFAILKTLLDFDIKDVLYLSEKSGNDKINQTGMAQPLLFVIEYALAKLLMAWGIKPYAMTGHSIGEYTAACLAGVFSLEDALKVVVRRGQLMQKMPPGAMLSVSLPEEKLKPLLNGRLSLAAVNSSTLCVVSGPSDAVAGFEKQLTEQGHKSRTLHTSHAFHSSMMEPILEEFTGTLKSMRLHEPQIPYISNLSGTWIMVEEATDPAYWSRHLRNTVRFSDGIHVLLEDAAAVFIEVGPGNSLSTFVRQHENRKNGQTVLNLLQAAQENGPGMDHFLTQIGRLWLNGVPIDWQAYHSTYNDRKKYRVPLPTYPFDRQQFKTAFYSFNPADAAAPLKQTLHRNPDMAEWFYIPTWNRACLSAYKQEKIAESLNWLIFIDDCGLGKKLIEKINGNIICVEKGNAFRGGSQFTINPLQGSDYELLFNELKSRETWPDRIVHLWSLDGKQELVSEHEVDDILSWGIYSLLDIARELGRQNTTKPVRIDVISDYMHEITGSEQLNPIKSTLLGPVKIIPQEFPHITCKSIDILLPGPGKEEDGLPELLITELAQESPERVIAYRGSYRWVPDFEAIRLDKSPRPNPRLKDGGVYLLTGGLGGIGLVLAETIAQTVAAPGLILLGRSEFPAREEWENWLFSHYDEDVVSRKIRKIRAMEQNGARVLTISADAADAGQMAQALARAREMFGQINGVIHAAGTADGGLIQVRKPELTRRVLAPKVMGTLILARLLAGGPLDFFVLCSSYSSILAPLGQVAYCSANAFLDAFAHYHNRRSQVFTTAINWDTWRETGMAFETVKRLENKQTPFVGEPAAAPVPVRAIKVDHPMFEKCIFDSPDQATFISTFDAERDWFIKEHIILGKMALSGTGYLEMARVAFEALEKKGLPVEIRDVFFFALLTVEEGERKEVRTIMTRHGDGYEFLVKSRAVPGKDVWQAHSTGKITALPAETPVKYEVKEVESLCSGPDKIITAEDHQTLPHGPRWYNLMKMRPGRDQQFSTAELPGKYINDLEHYGLHPALFDTLITFYDHRFVGYLPFSYKKIKIFGMFTRTLYSYLKISADNDPSERTIKDDVKIMDNEGNLLLDIESLTFARTGESTAQEGKQQVKPTAQIQDHKLLKDGLLSSEGAEAFKRILCASLPQVVVSVKDFKQILAERKAYKPEVQGEIGRMLGKSPAPNTHQRPDISTPYVPPQTDLEKRLARMFETFFGIDKFGINDSFFEMGGDSLNAITIANRFHKEFNVELPMAEFYSKPTVRELAKYINDASKSTFSSILPAEEKEYYILSSGQKRFYLLDQIKKGRLSNNIPIVFMMEGRLDKEKMTATFHEMVQRHESLRTSFHMVEGEPVQVIHKDTLLDIEYLETPEDKLDSLITNFFQPFDLGKAPLMRVAFIKVKEDLHVLAADFHHIISDGTMLAIFVREFTASYSGRELPPLKLQYKDYAEWQHNYNESEVIKKQEAYWLNEFKSPAPVLNLSRDFEKNAAAYFEIEGINFAINLDDVGVLKKIAMAEGATYYMILLALVNVFLHKITGQEDIVIGGAVAGRRHADLENIIGLFVNTLAMRNYPGAEKTFSEFLREVKERTLAAFENQDYQFENLVNKIAGTRSIDQDPLIDIVFALQNFGLPELEISGIKISTYSKFKNTATPFDYELRAYEFDDRTVMHFDYRTALYKRETMEKFLSYFQEIIAAVIKDKNTRLKDIHISHHLQEARVDTFQDYKEDFIF